MDKEFIIIMIVFATVLIYFLIAPMIISHANTPVEFQATNLTSATTSTTLTSISLSSTTIVSSITTSTVTTTIPQNITIYNNSTPLNLPNIVTLSQGQSTSFFGGSVQFISAQTTYQAPDVGNIHAYATTNWTATTYVTLKSTFPTTVQLSNIYFKSLNKNPSKIKIYELNTSQVLVSVSNTFITGTVNALNGTIIQQITNTITTNVLENISSWQQLKNNHVLISNGLNQFKIVGQGRPNTIYNWSYAFSTSNIISTALPASALGMLNAPKETINIDPTWIIPSGVSNIVNVSLNNLQTGNILGNTPILITLNGITYNSYFNGNLINFEVFNGLTGNILPSWLEGNVSNEYQSNGFNSVSNIILWVKLQPQSGNAIFGLANAVNVISIGFLSMSSTALSANVGIAPQLFCGSAGNCPQKYYAQYDSGANVFSFYDNFVGTTLSSAWTTNAAAKPTVSNGLSLVGQSPGRPLLYDLVTSFSLPNIEDSLASRNSGAGGIGWGQTSATGSYDNIFRIGILQEAIENPVGASQTTYGVAAASKKQVLTSVGVSATTINALVNYTQFTATLTGTATLLNPSITGDQNTGSYQWFKVRKYPPSGVMPTVVFGSIQTVSSGGAADNTPTLTATPNPFQESNTVIDIGQYATLNTIISNGVAPYSGNWAWTPPNTLLSANPSNTINNGILTQGINNAKLTFNGYASTNEVFTFGGTQYLTNALGTNTLTGVWTFTFGGFDSGKNTIVTSTNTVTLNPSLVAGAPSESNTIIDLLQFVVQTSHPSGGTPAYSYQWYSNTIQAPLCDATNTISGATSSTYVTQPLVTTNYAYKVTDSATTTNSACSTSDQTTVYPDPVGTITVSNSLLDSGQTEVYTLSITGGIGSFTANLVNYTGAGWLTPLANIIITSNSAGTNSISFVVSSPIQSNSFTMNYIFTDDGDTTNAVFNAIGKSFTVNTAPTVNTLIPTNIILDSGQYVVYNAIISNAGVGSFTANLMSNGVVVNTLTGQNPGKITFKANVPTNSIPVMFWNVTNNFVQNTLEGYGFGSVNQVIEISPGTNTYWGNILANGTINTWTASNNFPLGNGAFQCAYSNVIVACVGSGATNAVYNALVLPQGVGTWIASNNYPTNGIIDRTSCTQYNSYMYCIGGQWNAVTTNVDYYAPLTSTGVGTWTATTAYPTSIGLTDCVNYVNDIYCVGGSISGTTTNDVFYAGLSSTGIGQWASTSNYPIAIQWTKCQAYTGLLYCVGGNVGGSTDTSNVYYAPFNGQFGIGKWVQLTNYPTTVERHACSALNNFLYCIGGAVGSSGSTSSNQAYYTPIITNSMQDYNVVLTDTGTSTPYIFPSPPNALTINPAMNTLSITTPIPSSQATGNILIFTSTFTGGTNSYTYNWNIYNSITFTILANQLWTGNTFVGNTFSWTIPSTVGGNTVIANLIVTDSATNIVSKNSISSGVITIIGTTCTFTTSNAAINFGSLTQGTNTIGTTGSYNVITITNTGGNPSNILLSGSNWNFNSNTFKVSNTIWTSIASNNLWNPQSSNLKTGTANVEVQLSGSQVDTLQFTNNGITANTLWFGANAPTGSTGGKWAQTLNVISSC